MHSTWPTPTHPPSAIHHPPSTPTLPIDLTNTRAHCAPTDPRCCLSLRSILTFTFLDLHRLHHLHHLHRPWLAARRDTTTHPHGRRKHGLGRRHAIAPKAPHDTDAPVVDTIARIAVVAHRGRLPTAACAAQSQPPPRRRRTHAAHHVGWQEPRQVCQSEPSKHPRPRRRHPPSPPLSVWQLSPGSEQPSPWLQAQCIVGRHCSRSPSKRHGSAQEPLQRPPCPAGPGQARCQEGGRHDHEALIDPAQQVATPLTRRTARRPLRHGSG